MSGVSPYHVNDRDLCLHRCLANPAGSSLRLHRHTYAKNGVVDCLASAHILIPMKAFVSGRSDFDVAVGYEIENGNGI
jgi:hypothetical protein